MPAEKLPPHDLDAEEAVIGSLLIDGAAVHKIASFLKGEHFYYAQNQYLYDACFSLFTRADAIDQITVAQELARQNKLEQCGGVANLSRLISICPTALDIEDYANIVQRLYVMRELIKAGERITEIGYQAGPDADGSLNQAESALFRLRDQRNERDLVHIRSVLDGYLEPPPVSEEGQALPYVLSNFPALDDHLRGFQRSGLIIVAGRPSMGKTSFALAMARNAAVEQKACVAIFSLEMAREELVMRLVSSESGVNSRRFRFWHHDRDEPRTEYEERNLMKAINTLSEAPIYIDDSPMLRVFEMRSKARRLHHERGLDLVIIDHLGLMQADGKIENRVQEISYISRSLKALARDLNVPVLAVSQLSRAAERRPDEPRPKLSDLRDSGSIEQDADVVLFIYREEYYHPNEEQWTSLHPGQKYPRDQADIIIAKHRNGPIGEVKLRFDRGLAKFGNPIEEVRQADLV